MHVEFLIALITIAWLIGGVGAFRLLPKVFPSLQLPSHPLREGSLLVAILLAPLSFPLLLAGRTAQRLKLPLPSWMAEPDQLPWLSDYLREGGWEILVSDIGEDRPIKPDALYLHARLPDSQQELTVHHHNKGFTYSFWRDASHALPSSMAMLPTIDPRLPQLPHWEKALHRKRSKPQELPSSHFSRRYELYGHLFHYYALVGRSPLEPIAWADSEFAYACDMPSSHEPMQLPFSFSYLALVDGHVLLQQEVSSLQETLERDLEFFNTFVEHMPDLRDLNQLALLKQGLFTHINFVKAGRYSISQRKVARQLFEDGLKRFKAHHPNDGAYKHVLKELALLDMEGIDRLIKQYITSDNFHPLLKLAQSVNELEHERIRVLGLLCEIMPRTSLFAPLIKIAKDQRNTAPIKSAALRHWIDLHGKGDRADLREQLRTAEPPKLQAIIAVLTKVGDETDEAALLSCLDHKEEAVQLAAIEALRKHGSRGSMARLGQLAKDGLSRSIKRAAKDAADTIIQRLPEGAGGALSLTDGSEETGGQLSLDDSDQRGKLSLDDEP